LAGKGSLYVTRPTLVTYIAAREELVERSNALFDVVKSGKVKIAPSARYKLADAAQAHRDLEARKTTGSVVLMP
ncbi:MAG TPA: zinc-binding dehydrogenase, partial [Burkholderiales bacterium]|nr:zinc-binding dehydrogenase [Burkholderiales bacterium]